MRGAGDLGDGLGAELVADLHELVGDLVERLFPADSLPFAFAALSGALHRVVEALVGVVELRGRLHALAGEPSAHEPFRARLYLLQHAIFVAALNLALLPAHVTCGTLYLLGHFVFPLSVGSWVFLGSEPRCAPPGSPSASQITNAEMKIQFPIGAIAGALTAGFRPLNVHL